MEVIDEKGRVFGVVNVVDLLVVLLVLAVVAAGAALVLGSNKSETETVTITVRAEEVQPYVAEAVPPTGALEDGNVSRIVNKSVQPATVVTTNASGAVLVLDHPRLKTVELTVAIEATGTDGDLVWNEKPLKVGKTVGLDLGKVEIRGNVTSVGVSS